MLVELWSDVVHRLRALFRGDRVDEDLEAELRFHLEQETAKEIARGRSPDEAARRARLSLGGVTQTAEAHRRARGIGAIERVHQDLHYAVRVLRRSPGFVITAVLSIGLGIGANAAIFSAVDALFLRRMAVERPEELVTFEQQLADGTRQYNLSFLDYERIRDDHRTLAGVAAVAWGEVFDVATTSAQLAPPDGPSHVSAVTGDYFALLGVPMSLGRPLASTDDADGAPAAAVLAAPYATRIFGGAREALGGRLVANGTTFTVVGVVSPGFTGDWVGWPTDFWIASSRIDALHPESGPGAPRTRFQFKVVARRLPRSNLRETQAWAEVFYRRMLADPPANTGIARGAHLEVRSLATGYSPQREAAGRPLAVLLVIGALILAIACANLTNILLARAMTRRREIAMRMAIGAGRARLVQQMLTETSLVVVVGAAVGVGVAVAGMRGLEALLATGPASSLAGASNPGSLQLDLRLDGRLVVFCGALCLTIAAAIGILPAVRGTRMPASPIVDRLSEADRRRSFGMRDVLITAQIALSLILVVATVLFSRTLGNLERQSLGFDRSRLLLTWTLPGPTRRDPRGIATLWQQIVNDVAAIPGVRSVGISAEGLLDGGSPAGPLVTVDGGALADSVRVRSTMTVSPGFFATIGQRLDAGRDFTHLDTDSAPNVVIVNQSLVRQLFRGRSALGQRLRLRGVDMPFEIIGVVHDAKRSPRDVIAPAIYYPPRQNLRRLTRGLVIVARVDGDPLAMAATMRSALRRIEPRLAILDIDTVEGQLARVLTRERLLAMLSLLFGALAVLLVCVGVYGVVTSLYSRRVREIGIRLALGATRRRVVEMVIVDTLRLSLAGALAGLLGVALGGQVVRSQLYDVAPNDPLVVGGSVLGIVLVALGASLLPAYRASRADPIAALRAD